MNEIKINNGIGLYSMTNSAMHKFCIGIYVKAGCMYEPNEVNGITHLYEHMIFRNVKSRYNTDFYELLTQNGIFFEAGTYREFLYFTVSGLPSGLELATEIISMMFDDIKLEKEDFITEKNRVKAEIRESTEKQTLSYFADCEVWKGTPLENTILGTCKSIDKISRKKLNEYKNEIISKDNLFVYVTGNVDNTGMELIEQTVAGVKISGTELKRNNSAPVPSDFCKRNASVSTKPANYHRVRISIDVDNAICPVDVRDIIYSTLFVDENAMIFQEMSENNPMVYSYDSVFEQYRNISNLKLEYEISKKHVKESVLTVLKVLDRLKNGDFNFENNLQKLLTQWELVQDNISELNWCLAYENHIMESIPIDYSKEKFGRYSELTKEKVMEYAKQIFVSSNISVAIKGDKKYIETLDIHSLVKEFS